MRYNSTVVPRYHRPRVTRLVGEGLVMSESGLANRDSCGIVAALGAAYGVGCCGEEWLRKRVNPAEGERKAR